MPIVPEHTLQQGIVRAIASKIMHHEGRKEHEENKPQAAYFVKKHRL
jgi:hypothetical protein